MALSCRKQLLLITLLFLSLRLGYLFFYVEHTWSPEEAYRGSVALEFIRGLQSHPLPLPLWCYQADSYLGGSLVTATLSVASFLLFGSSYFSLKLSALLFALGSLIAGFLALRLVRGCRNALSFALLLSFAPPGFISLSLLAMGYHTESALFLALFLYLLARAEMSPSRWLAFSLGLLGGFSIWFSPLNSLAFFAAALAWPSQGRRNCRNALQAASGFGIGFSPWILHELQTGGAALAYLSAAIPAPDLRLILRKLALLPMRDLPLSLGLPQFYAQLTFGVLLLLAVWGWKTLPQALRRFSVLYAGLFALAYAFSRYDLSLQDSAPYRYLQSLNLLFLFLAAASLPKLPGKGRLRLGLTGAFCLCNLAVLLLETRNLPPGRALAYRGFSDPDLAARLMTGCLAGGEKWPALAAWIESYPQERRSLLALPLTGLYSYEEFTQEKLSRLPSHFFSVAEGLGAFHARSGASPESLGALSAIFPEEARQKFWRGVAAGSAGALASIETPPEWRLFYLGLASAQRQCQRNQPIPKVTAPWSLRGQGAALVNCAVFPQAIGEKTEEWAASLNSEERQEMAWGLGWWLRMRHAPDPLLALDQLHRLPAWAWAGAEKGALAFEKDQQLGENESITRFTAKSAERTN